MRTRVRRLTALLLALMIGLTGLGWAAAEDDWRSMLRELYGLSDEAPEGGSASDSGATKDKGADDGGATKDKGSNDGGATKDKGANDSSSTKGKGADDGGATKGKGAGGGATKDKGASGGGGEIEDRFELPVTDPQKIVDYLELYGELPENFITKDEAKALGWDSRYNYVGEVAPGKSIGGDRFGNYEGQLPKKKGRQWYECDANYRGKKRGPERVLFSSDGLYYYTDDHYQTFIELFPEDSP